MKTKIIIKNSIALGIAAVLANTALAADSRCEIASNRVAICLGDPNVKDTPQEPILFGNIGYGIIVKDFDYLVPKHTGGSAAEQCCGAWTSGIVAYGNMSAPDDWTPHYEPGTAGMYISDNTIQGSSDWQQIAGILHYNSLNFDGSGGLWGHGDYIYVDDLNIDITNANTSPIDHPTPWAFYRAFGVISENEGRNKNTNVNIRGNSNITINRTCKVGQACFLEGYNPAGILAMARQGDSTINVEQDVVINVNGDHSFGGVVHTQDGFTQAQKPIGTFNNKGTVNTNGIMSHGLYIASDQIKGDQSLLTNSGYVRTLGKDAHGMISAGYRANTVTNDGAVVTLGENAKGIFITNQKRTNDLANTTNLVFTENSIIQGGYNNSAAAVHLNNLAGTQSIDNKGYIDGINYRAIAVTGVNSGPLELNDAGYINGYQDIQNTTAKVINGETGILNLENFDSMGGKLAVESIFSSNNSGVFHNYGIVQFSLNGYGSPSMGTYAGLNAFYAHENSTIDLTRSNPLISEQLGIGENNQVGDKFVISNTAQNTTYYSDGGILKLNVDLTKGTQSSAQTDLADHLVLDNTVTLNNKPTLIKVVATKNSLAQAKPTGEQGILLIEVRQQSDSNAFALQSPVKVGNVEYVLKQVNKNWYLVSK